MIHKTNRNKTICRAAGTAHGLVNFNLFSLLSTLRFHNWTLVQIIVQESRFDLWPPKSRISEWALFCFSWFNSCEMKSHINLNLLFPFPAAFSPSLQETAVRITSDTPLLPSSIRAWECPVRQASFLFPHVHKRWILVKNMSSGLESVGDFEVYP